MWNWKQLGANGVRVILKHKNTNGNWELRKSDSLDAKECNSLIMKETFFGFLKKVIKKGS